jgi:hypothetical protein
MLVCYFKGNPPVPPGAIGIHEPAPRFQRLQLPEHPVDEISHTCKCV